MPTPVNISISEYKSSEKAIKEINEHFDSLRDLSVCLVCDTFVNPNDVRYISVDQLLHPEFKSYLMRQQSIQDAGCGDNRFDPLPAAVADYYTYSGRNFGRTVSRSEKREIKSMLLSPRGTFRQGEKSNTTGFLICKSCQQGVWHKRMPKYAIANNFYVGTPPQCLLDLNEVELALLTPMRTHGYCFSYTGGKKTQIRGSLIYFKIDVKKIVATAAQFDVLGLQHNVVVLLYGVLTKDQKKRVLERSTIRTDNVLRAVQWLIVNHREWQSVDYRAIVAELNARRLSPEVINRFRTAENSDNASDLEQEHDESFEVFYPDGTTVTTNTGESLLDSFSEVLSSAKKKGYAVALRRNFLSSRQTNEFHQNNFIQSCLLQFPYGIGGLRTPRYNGNGRTCSIDAREYARHLSQISQPHFHYDLFILQLFNLKLKQDMFINTSFCVRGNLSAADLLEKFSVNDLERCIQSRIRGDVQEGTPTSRKILNIIDCVSRSNPLSAEAAKRARQIAEAHMHEFGLPTFFLTACPDDDNNIIIQIMANEIIDDNRPIHSLTDDELHLRSKRRTAVRMRYPGICALYFEYALRIILCDVIGWDIKKKKAVNGGGIFGETLAVAGSIEEQGRGTLHCHLQIWVKDFIGAANNLHSQFEAVATGSAKRIVDTMDKLACASLFDVKHCPTHMGSYGLFDHDDCKEKNPYARKPPEIVKKQPLRQLRHRRGQVACNHLFAMCPHCSYTLTNLQLIEEYLKNAVKHTGLTQYPDIPKRLKAYLIQYQKGNLSAEELLKIPLVVNAAYNHHIHTSSCFACKAEKERKKEVQEATKKRSKRENAREECRYRFPTCPSQNTKIRNLSELDVRWFKWDGTYTLRKIKELVLKRHPYDVFQNSCCRAISHSKLSCNSNLQFVNPGPLIMYTYFYSFKSTQEEDTAKYSSVSSSVKNYLERLDKKNKASGDTSSPRARAIGMVLSACYAHQKESITSPGLAAFTLRTDSGRFIFSHTVVWCPLKDLDAFVNGDNSFTTIRHVLQTPIYVNGAMNYLCRPPELSHISVFEFFSEYDVVDNDGRGRSQSETFQFTNHYYEHPSYQEGSKRMLQCIVTRETKCLIRVPQFLFPDTANFNGCILDPQLAITEDTEQYAKLVLLLFCPFRSVEDITESGSYTAAFRTFVRTGMLTQQAKQWLQNLQDCRANAFRLSQVEDELQQNTTIYCENNGSNVDPQESDSDDNVRTVDTLLEKFEDTIDYDYEGLSSYDATFDTDMTHIPAFSTETIRNSGKEECGWEHLAVDALNNDTHPIWEAAQVNSIQVNLEEPVRNGVPYSQRNPQKHELATLLLEHVDRRSRTFAEISNNLAQVNVLEPNGSARSIADWSTKANLDSSQKRAFEVLTASFIRTFYVNDDLDTSAPPILQEEFEHLGLLAGIHNRESEQLICLLHGPGGSGKTTVINLLLLYAREFCGYLKHFTFHERTIVVTAMSGVAATHLLGETTHSAVHLNKKIKFSEEHLERWEDTRLLIIDEISFASKREIELLNNNLNKLLQTNRFFHGHKYGGLHIVFCGDFCQLEPVASTFGPLYKTTCTEFNNWINCFLELEGMHRFSEDPEYGEFLQLMRKGEATPKHIDWINSRVVLKDNQTQDGDCVPANIRYCTYDNRDRDAINAGLFVHRCSKQYKRHGQVDDSIIVFCDKVEARNDSKYYQPFPNQRVLHEECSETDIEVNNYGVGRLDPALKLYIGCPVMLPYNKNVSKGLANGTQGVVERIILSPGTVPRKILLEGSIPINSVQASEIQSIRCRHTNPRIQPPSFSAEPTSSSFSAKINDPAFSQNPKKISLRMRATQVPLILNSATTGHKLQGSSVDALFINSWHYQDNWPYVVLSRVRTKRGLFLRKPLVWADGRFTQPEGLLKMLEGFKKLKPDPISDAQYASFEIFDADTYTSQT